MSKEVENVLVRFHDLHQLQFSQQLLSLHTRSVVCSWNDRKRERDMLLNIEQIKSENLSSECLSAACLKSQ